MKYASLCIEFAHLRRERVLSLKQAAMRNLLAFAGLKKPFDFVPNGTPQCLHCFPLVTRLPSHFREPGQA